MNWPLALVPSTQPSRTLTWLSPVAAAVLTMLAGAVLFALMGKDPLQGLRVFLVEPLATQRGWSELALKATPLMLCAVGTLQPVVDGVRRNRCGQRAEICGRRTGEAGELLETPMGQGS